MGRKWTDEEIEYLVKNFYKEDREVLKSKLNREWGSISNKATRLKLRRCENATRGIKEEDGVLLKKCSRCGRYIPLDEDHFFRDKYKNTGFVGYCKECGIDNFTFGDKRGLFDVDWKKIDCKSGIYKITNLVTNKIYIGSAVDFCMRWSVHYDMLRKNKHENSYMQNAWNKYGSDNFKFEMIEKVSNKENLLSREQYWLDYYKSYNREIGYNILKIAGSSLGNVLSEEAKDKLRNINNKPICQFDSNGVFMREFLGTNDVERTLGYTSGSICNVCNGKYPHAYGFLWIYKDDVDKDGFEIKSYVERLREYKLKQNNQRVFQFSLSGELIKEWDSIKEASDKLNIKDYNILSCCKGRQRTTNGFIWRLNIDDDISDSLKNKKGILVDEYLNGELIFTWSNVSELAKSINEKRENLRYIFNKKGVYEKDNKVYKIKRVA